MLSPSKLVVVAVPAGFESVRAPGRASLQGVGWGGAIARGTHFPALFPRRLGPGGGAKQVGSCVPGGCAACTGGAFPEPGDTFLGLVVAGAGPPIFRELRALVGRGSNRGRTPPALAPSLPTRACRRHIPARLGSAQPALNSRRTVAAEAPRALTHVRLVLRRRQGTTAAGASTSRALSRSHHREVRGCGRVIYCRHRLIQESSRVSGEPVASAPGAKKGRGRLGRA